MEKLYTIPEAAEELRCSVVTIRRRIKSGELKSFRNGKKYLITQSQLDDFLTGANKSPTATEPVKEKSAINLPPVFAKKSSISLEQALKENRKD